MEEHAASSRGPTATTERSAPGEPTGRERQRQLTHRRIVRASIAEFERVGVAQARVEHICRAAGVTRPTFYAHFPNKEDVILELQRRAATAIGDAILARMREAVTLSEVMDSLVDGLFAAAGSVSHRLRREILSLDVRERTRSSWDGTPLVDALVRHFEAAGRRGEIDAGHDPLRLTRCVLVTLLGFLAGAEGDFEPSRADARATLRALAKGLRGSCGPGA